MPRFVQRSALELNPIAGVEPIPSGTAGSTVVGSYFDLTTDTTTLSSAFNEFLFNLAVPLGDTVTIENLTPTISDVSAWPHVSRVSSGLAGIRINYRDFSATKWVNMRTLTGGTSSYSVVGFEAGTVGELSWGFVEPLLTTGGSLSLLNGGVLSGGNWNFAGGTYNPGCWCGYDFSGVAHRNSQWGTPHFAGTLITRRHLVMASHYLPAVGTTLLFIAPDGTKINRTISGYNTGNTFNGKLNTNPVIRDLAVAVLSSDIPESIPSYSVAGEWIYTATDLSGVPAHVAAWVGFKLDQQRRVMLAGATHLSPVYNGPQTATYEGNVLTKEMAGVRTDWGAPVNLPALLTDYSDFYLQSVIGDSGSPRFIPVSESELVLVGCVTTDDGTCPFLDPAIVNACIASADSNAGISTGYTVTVAPDPTL